MERLLGNSIPGCVNLICFVSTVPSHEQSLQQIVVLKNELAELRASIANKEEDYHKTESEIHAEVRNIKIIVITC
jgi:hypothetical protein